MGWNWWDPQKQRKSKRQNRKWNMEMMTARTICKEKKRYGKLFWKRLGLTRDFLSFSLISFFNFFYVFFSPVICIRLLTPEGNDLISMYVFKYMSSTAYWTVSKRIFPPCSSLLVVPIKNQIRHSCLFYIHWSEQSPSGLTGLFPPPQFPYLDLVLFLILFAPKFTFSYILYLQTCRRVWKEIISHNVPACSFSVWEKSCESPLCDFVKVALSGMEMSPALAAAKQVSTGNWKGQVDFSPLKKYKNKL